MGVLYSKHKSQIIVMYIRNVLQGTACEALVNNSTSVIITLVMDLTLFDLDYILCILCSSLLCHFVTCGNKHKLSANSLLPLTPIHSLYHPPYSHHSGMSPPGVWPLKGGPLELPTSVRFDHPEDCVGHGQHSTQ